jgi:hypothetical protein
MDLEEPMAPSALLQAGARRNSLSHRRLWLLADDGIEHAPFEDEWRAKMSFPKI